jgi:hypothetical protein
MDEWQAYPYTSRSHRRGRPIYRPLIDVDVSSGRNTERVTALLDSGSEVTVMSEEIGLILGISPVGKKIGKISGFGEKEGFAAPVRIVVPEFPDEVISTTVVFVLGVSSDFPFDILLGQDDFFRRFHIQFEKNKNKFYLRKAK